jgi:hypothetical protein
VRLREHGQPARLAGGGEVDHLRHQVGHPVLVPGGDALDRPAGHPGHVGRGRRAGRGVGDGGLEVVLEPLR